MTDKPWHEVYDDFGIPESLEPYPEKPGHSFLREAAESHPSMGLVQPGRSVDYADADDAADALAAELRESGVEKGDKVVSILPTSTEFVITVNAVSKAGGINVPVDPIESTDRIVERLSKVSPTVVVGSSGRAGLASEIGERTDVDEVILAEVGGGDRDAVVLDDATSFDSVTQKGGTAPETGFQPDDTHTILFTGGTTGEPKGCVLTHRNVVANALQVAAAQSRAAELMRGDAVVLNCLPFYHAYGYSTMHTFTHLGTQQVLIPDPRDTETIARMIREHDPLLVIGVPTQFQEISDAVDDVGAVGISGSAPLTEGTREEFGRKARGLSQGYGLSEMSPVTHFDIEGIVESISGTSNRETEFDVPTVGVPVPDTEVRLADPETGERIDIEEAVEENVEAEMLLNGPQRMKGYVDGSESFSDGYVETGDVVRVDERGRFYVVDRVKDMINVSGLKVYSVEVDEVLESHPEVRRGATVGVPDPDRPGSELVKVYVEAEDDADLGPDELKEFFEGEVAKHAVPDVVEFVDEMPLTSIGKVDKKALKQDGK